MGKIVNFYKKFLKLTIYIKIVIKSLKLNNQKFLKIYRIIVNYLVSVIITSTYYFQHD